MASGTLKFLSITYCWPLVVSVPTVYLMYLVQYDVISVFLGKPFSEIFNLGYCLYFREPVLVWIGGGL